MMTADTRNARFKSGDIASVTVIVLAYVVTFAGYYFEGVAISPARLGLAIALGVIYLWLTLAGFAPFRRFGRNPDSPVPAAIYFTIQVALILLISALADGSTGIWLIIMPLVATATTDLPPLPRWLVYIAVVAGQFLVIFQDTGSLRVALLVSLYFVPAVVFVVVFVRLTQAAEIARCRAEELSSELTDANHRLSAHAVQAEELAINRERQRVAREIHDNLGHYLTAANVQIQAARAVMDKDPARAHLALDRAAELTQDGLAAVRDAIYALRDSPLGAQPLPDALAALVAEAQSAGLVADLVVTGDPRPLDPRAELTVYRAAQEGLTNVRKHARASRVDVRLNYAGQAAVALTVRDNGLGLQSAANGQGFGLLGLRERARQLGGTLTFDAAPEGGACLTITVPVKDEKRGMGDEK